MPPKKKAPPVQHIQQEVVPVQLTLQQIASAMRREREEDEREEYEMLVVQPIIMQQQLQQQQRNTVVEISPSKQQPAGENKQEQVSTIIGSHVGSGHGGSEMDSEKSRGRSESGASVFSSKSSLLLQPSQSLLDGSESQQQRLSNNQNQSQNQSQASNEECEVEKRFNKLAGDSSPSSNDNSGNKDALRKFIRERHNDQDKKLRGLLKQALPGGPDYETAPWEVPAKINQETNEDSLLSSYSSSNGSGARGGQGPSSAPLTVVREAPLKMPMWMGEGSTVSLVRGYGPRSLFSRQTEPI